MQSLVSLDFSENKLSGEIPSSLSSLTLLEALNLSYNNLSGRIPSGRQLDTLNSDNRSLIYIGNSGLCGLPLHRGCSGNVTSIHGDLGSNKQEFDPLSFHFGLVLGLVVGLWVVFFALLFKRTWRIAYFRLFDEVYDQVYVFVVVKWASFAKNTATDIQTSCMDEVFLLPFAETNLCIYWFHSIGFSLVTSLSVLGPYDCGDEDSDQTVKEYLYWSKSFY
ncbi:Protein BRASSINOSTEROID INSENSITIVE 1 [Triticum urartu]|uniref:Protein BRASSINOSTEROID INSENSITIVE 1 n=1 Tax=Triticum urartu TaxID=4572 RepID=M7XL07_TRIUA|nr:Protein BRASSINOSTEROID INSENSITIVE 1 [Triticum urartu]